MQQRNRASGARRVFAAIACAWLVVFGVLGGRHEANVVHVRDLATGELHHATPLVGAHTGDQSDYHATRDGHADHDACALSSAFHQAARPHVATTFARPLRAIAATDPSCDSRVTARSAAVYRLAPKTSPPARS